MTDNRLNDQRFEQVVSSVVEKFLTSEIFVSEILHELARLSNASDVFAKLRWTREEDDGSYKTKALPYRQLRINGAIAETDCAAIGEARGMCRISVDSKYFSAPINKGLLSVRSDGVYCNCLYSIAKLERNLSGNGDVEVGLGESWTDRGPQFGPMGRDYRNVRLVADYDVVRDMLDSIREKCKDEFWEILNSENQLKERIMTMKKTISVDISGSGNQVSLGNGTVTQQQTAAKGMFSKANIGDVDSSSHIETESFVSGILRHWKVLAVISGIAGLLLAYVFWKGVDITVEKGDCKINIQTRR